MRAVSVLLVGLLLAACAGEGADSSTTSTTAATTALTASPSGTDGIAATATTTTSTSTTWPVPLLASVMKVDPVTLEPVEGVEPIRTPEGMLVWVSPNGRWLAGRVWVENAPDRLLVLDTESWEIITETRAWGMVIGVTDDGTVHVRRSAPTHLIRSLPLGSEEWARVIEFGEGLEVIDTAFGAEMIGENRFGALVYAVTSDGQNTEMEPRLVVADTSEGTVSEIPLGDLTIGRSQTGLKLDHDYPVVEVQYPAVVWSEGRALIVHADQNVVTEVHLDTGDVSTHMLASESSVLDHLLAWLIPPASAKGGSTVGVTRDAVLSRDGHRLFIAGQERDISRDSEGEWVEEVWPMGLTIVDTRTWTIERVLDIPVGSLVMSPDRSMILATGHTEEGHPVTGERFEFSASGVYAISPATLEVERLTDGGEWETAIEFGRASSLAYLTNWSTDTGLTTIDVLDLESLEIVGSRSGVHLEVHGPAGVVSEWDGGRS